MKEFLEKLSAERCTDYELQGVVDLSRSVNESGDDAAKNMYFARYRRDPNEIRLDDVDARKANLWLVQNCRDSIKDCVFKKRKDKGKELFYDDVFYFMHDDLLLYLDETSRQAYFFYRKTDVAVIDMLVEQIRKFRKRGHRRKPEIELLVSRSHGLSTETMEITRPRFSVEDNYNDDFIPVHQTIVERLRRKNDKGLVLLHGKPGTGKTSYIRYLITRTTKPVLFLPPNMAASVTDPGLMNVLIDHPNSVFIIEDAENILIDRNQSGSSSVSSLLNLADGLLSDCLNIQIVCSFNTDLARVDSALTRKGRLIAKYEFQELTAAKAQALSAKLGFSSVISTPMTVASVYNQNETDFGSARQRKPIGFGVAV